MKKHTIGKKEFIVMNEGELRGVNYDMSMVMAYLEARIHELTYEKSRIDREIQDLQKNRDLLKETRKKLIES